MAAAAASSTPARGFGNCPRATVVRRFEAQEVDVVSCHALTPDGALLAICPNTEEVLLYQLVGSEFKPVQTLSKHTQRVTGLSWSSPDGGAGGALRSRLVSCSEDRTAYVWQYDNGAKLWRPAIVELAAPRAALCVAWAPNGERFAVGLASKDTSVCYYRAESQCWVALKVGQSRAAVVSVAWHYSSQYLATGSTDGRCVVYDVSDENMLPEPRAPFGEAQVSEDAGAWVNSVMFSPTGRYLAFLSHDSTVRIKDLSQGPTAPVLVLRWKGLPLLRGTFLSDKSLVACGFDGEPVLVKLRWDAQWEVSGALDARPVASGPQAPQAQAAGAQTVAKDTFAEARSKFGGGVAAAAAAAAKQAEAPSTTWHTMPITGCAPLGPGVAATSQFSTSSLDGQVLVWELAA